MKTYFARHSGQLALDDHALAELRKDCRIAIHFPFVKGGVSDGVDADSLDPAKYERPGKAALNCLLQIAKYGGYICASYRDTRNLTLGRVSPGTPIELREAVWSTDSRYPGRKAILKSLKYSKLMEIPPARQSLLLSVQPTQGTLCEWRAVGDKVMRLATGTPWEEDFGSLHSAYQEVLCSEFLRSHDIPGLPRLQHLLLPVGRTMADVDILGIADDGKNLRAQVTFTSSEDKLRRLAEHGDEITHLVYFCRASTISAVGRVWVVPVSLAFEKFRATPSGREWIARVGELV
jgi:hypothetical protein